MLTHGSGHEGVRIVLVGLQRPEDVRCGMQRARPDNAQPREVKRQQRQLAAQHIRLHQDMHDVNKRLQSNYAQPSEVQRQ